MTSKRKNKIKQTNKFIKSKESMTVIEKIVGCDGSVIMLEYPKNHAPRIKVMCGE